jgi:TRAP-type C4-dicarboxylate transport system permease small subunit
VYSFLLFLHFLGWAILLGGIIASLVAHTHHRHFGIGLLGSLLALLSGFGLMFTHPGNRVANAAATAAEGAARGFDSKMLVKLLLTLALAGLIYYAWRLAKRAAEDVVGGAGLGDGAASTASAVGSWLKYLIAALAILTVALSIFWR